MANTRQVQQRISTAKNISKITKAMEMVSASKMRRAQDQTLAARPYAQALANSLRSLAAETSPDLHPLLSRHNLGIEILVVIATDRGLCGSLNQSLLKQVTQWVAEHPQGELILVGKKSVAFAQFLNLNTYAQFTNMPDTIGIEDVLPISTLIINKFVSKEFRSVELIFTDFINTLSQQACHSQLLPIKLETDELIPANNESAEYLFEPNAREILEELLPYYIENAIFQAFLEAKASEHSARMVAMKNASENAKELVSELQLIYNKSRQESITNELLEITTATLSLQG